MNDFFGMKLGRVDGSADRDTGGIYDAFKSFFKPVG